MTTTHQDLMVGDWRVILTQRAGDGRLDVSIGRADDDENVGMSRVEANGAKTVDLCVETRTE